MCVCVRFSPQPCTTRGLPPFAIHQHHLDAWSDGSQQRRHDLPLPVCCLQLFAGNTVFMFSLYTHLRSYLYTYIRFLPLSILFHRESSSSSSM